MVERSYTVKEIDDLRQTLINKQAFGIYDRSRARTELMIQEQLRSGLTTFVFNPSIDYVLVEEQIRTHMLAGHTAQDLIDSEGKEEVIVRCL